MNNQIRGIITEFLDDTDRTEADYDKDYDRYYDEDMDQDSVDNYNK